jgi:hypothetical protein
MGGQYCGRVLTLLAKRRHDDIMRLTYAGFRREDTAAQKLEKLEAVLAPATSDLGEAAPLLAGEVRIARVERRN